MANLRDFIKDKKRIVVKVGTSTLTHDTGKLNFHRIERLVMEISDLKNEGKEMLLVSSGAVGAGMSAIGTSEKPKTMREKQALAAIGQGSLMHIYEKMFREYNQLVGQILLTRASSKDRKHFMNSRNTLLTMLDMGVIPIINENDAVAVDELKFGDNDTLSAIVACLVEADLLIILSDVDGLYSANPMTDTQAEIIREVTEINKHVYDISGGAGTTRGTGGMHTKIDAAAIATSAGIDMIIASGLESGILGKVCHGEEIGTIFKAKDSNLHTKKRWLVSGTRVAGSLVVDRGCRDAIVNKGSSLLPVGVIGVEGTFHEGDVVKIVYDSLAIAKGIVYYNSTDIEAIKGLRTNEVHEILGHDSAYDEIIHRDNLVLMQ